MDLDKLTKPILEVKYLSAENAHRYRIIMRFFYHEHENLHYTIYKEEVYDYIKNHNLIEQYSMDLCLSDLNQLSEWGNLITTQDSTKVKTIEDFKNRKYRYQLSEYSVEIERMTIRLENLETEGSSLESSTIERIYKQLKDLNTLGKKKDLEIHGAFNMLFDDFKKMIQNYQDYIKTLDSAKAEELMKTEAFLVYKDSIILYLRQFVVNMQSTGNAINSLLKHVDYEYVDTLIHKASDYEYSIPRMNSNITKEEIYDRYKGKWNSLVRWFIGSSNGSDFNTVYERSNEIIRKIARYAKQISEMLNRGSNRKEQYLHIASLFSKCNSIEEAHCMSAYIFGVEKTYHIDYIKPRLSDSTSIGVYDESQSEAIFEPRARVSKVRHKREPYEDKSIERMIKKQEIQEELARRMQRIQELEMNHCIDFKQLPVIDANVRKTLLLWITRGLSNESKQGKTNDGRVYHINTAYKDERIEVICEDGSFTMPRLIIEFKE